MRGTLLTMQAHSSKNTVAVRDRALAISLATAITFIFGYGVTRLALQTTIDPASPDTQIQVVPHQGELWSDFGR
ncbi:MAG: hypothetical protein AAGG02_07200 [Cyanobacteria bacterium P01_H01_bin.15]